MNKSAAHLAYASLFGTGEFGRPYHCAVIVAHPCDEVFGAGGLISRLKTVKIIHVTGSKSDDKLVTESDDRLRTNECAQALSLLPIPPKHIIELGLIDTTGSQFLVTLTRKIAAFLQRSATDILLTHPYEGGHPDHDATAFATHAAMQLLKRNGFTPPVLFEIAVRPTRDGLKRVLDFLPGSWNETTTWVLDEKAKQLKQTMLHCLTIDKDDLNSVSLRAEKFRRPPLYDFSRRSLKGKAYYENFVSGVTGDEWSAFARSAWSVLFPTN